MPKLIKPEQIQLSNGLPVILQHFDGPVAATYWWVKTGSADESPKEAGFAHFLEHMLFKDAAAKETGKASTGQMARAIESLGGDINAYTSFDQTVYHVTCAAHHWERVLETFGTMAKPQRFLKSDFESEREVILEELRKNEDSPGRQLFQSLFTQTFKKHPYGKPVIGYVKTLKAAKVGELEAFYKRNYVSSRMGLVLVGPFQDGTGARKKTILNLLEKKFGSRVLPRKPSTDVPRKHDEALAKGPALSVRAFDVKTPTLSVSFRVPDLMHSDIPALDVLSSILGSGELGRIYQRLFYQTSLATEASGGLYVPKDPGMLYFQAETESVSKLNELAEELFKELRRICDEGPTEEELSRALVGSESERLYATQTADGMAGRLGFMGYIIGDLEFDRQYLEDLRDVDSARVREAAQHYLDYRRMSAVALVPLQEKDFDMTAIGEAAKRILTSEKKIADSVQPVLVKKAKGKARAQGDLSFERIALPSGIRAVFVPRPQSHVVSVHTAVLGGVRMEVARPLTRPEADWGASNMMSLTWTKGTSKHNAQQIAGIVEGCASSLEGFSGRNSIGLQLTGLARDWGKLSSILTETLLEPTFPQEEVEHSKRVAEDSVRSIEDHSSQLCSKLFLETLFEKHPYGKITLGSLESIAGLDHSRLKAFHQAWLRPDRLVLAISGNVKRSLLESWLSDLDTAAKALQSHASAAELPQGLPDEPELKAPRWVEKNVKREQTHILVGGLGTKVSADDRHALRLLQNILGGQSGRLFIELREKKSLAYTVAPVSFEGLERGYVGTYIACAPQKRDEALAGIKQVLENLVRKGPSEAEMKRAKEFLLGKRAMDLQSDSSLASHYGLEELYRLPHMTEDAIIQRVSKISPKEVREVCRKYLVDPHQVTAIVG